MHIERAIQKALVSYLRTKYHGSNLKIAANNNEHARHAVDLGVDVGSADLTLSTRVGNITHFLYLEIKKTKGRLKPAQIEWNTDFDANFAADNCERAVGYGLAECREIIDNWMNKKGAH